MKKIIQCCPLLYKTIAEGIIKLVTSYLFALTFEIILNHCHFPLILFITFTSRHCNIVVVANNKDICIYQIIEVESQDEGEKKVIK